MLGHSVASGRWQLAGLLFGASICLSRPGAVGGFLQGKNVKRYYRLQRRWWLRPLCPRFARHLGKHIPGNPTVVPLNMVGAGSLRAATYIYSVAPKDGTTIGTFSRSVAIAPLIASAKFDTRRFTWLGSITKDVSVCITWRTSHIKSWKMP